jgi:cytochrome subunit of sulfide dehydrogenase
MHSTSCSLRFLPRCALAAVLTVCAGGAAAQSQPPHPPIAGDANTLRVRSLAATCANCHGTHGVAVANANVPGLAGLPASYISEQMKAFKNGTRPATVMHQLAKGYSDAQIEQIAAYFAAQKR